MSEKVKLWTFIVFGLGCKSVFFIISLVVSFWYNKSAFAVLVGIVAVHNVGSYLYRDFIKQAQRKAFVREMDKYKEERD